MKRLAEKEDEYKISWIKRFMEYESLIPGFHEEEAADPEAVLKKYGFPLTVQEISFYPLREGELMMRPVFPDSAAQKYADFMNAKIGYRDALKEAGIPSHPAMQKWHRRQRGRCMAELGARTDALVHIPFTLELSDGCSVGCSFCGLNAGKLKSLFRYTEENAVLFRSALTGVKELIGDAAGQGTMYFASEPMDNPDYESFLKIYREVFHTTPQITTAAAMRNPERMHRLLKEINEEGTTVYRFSVLSEALAQQIFAEFTPEELVYTELLPQYKEAPGSAFANSGRMAEANGVYDNTISCVTGFVVNFANRTVRLTAPTSSSPQYPTGEIILGRESFADADNLIEVMRKMISTYMSNIISPLDRVQLRQNLTWNIENNEVIVQNNKGVRFTIKSGDQTDFYRNLMTLLSSGYHTKREIVAELIKGYDQPVMTHTFHYCINRLWELGILELESGKI